MLKLKIQNGKTVNPVEMSCYNASSKLRYKKFGGMSSEFGDSDGSSCNWAQGLNYLKLQTPNFKLRIIYSATQIDRKPRRC